jgi:hypothetical protein
MTFAARHGLWSEAQRALLGLPGRETLARAGQAAWAHLLTQPRLQLLWRTRHQPQHRVAQKFQTLIMFIAKTPMG